MRVATDPAGWADQTNRRWESLIARRRFGAGPRGATWVGLGALAAAVVTLVVLLGGGTGTDSGPAGTGAGRAPGGPARLTSVPADPSVITPISVSGDRIVRGGRPWWLTGYNSFVWSGDCGSGPEKMSAAQVDAWFASLRHDGHGAVRLFFFPGWNLERLDAAVASARKYGVYVTITVADGRADCGEVAKDAAWFADTGERTLYRDHLTGLVRRYKGDPTIAWFEYFNEPTDAGGALRPFLDEMGAAAKGIDPTRLFSSGTAAPYGVGGDDAFRNVTASPGVDLASLHEYDENENESHHGAEVRAGAGGKPVVVGEFGIRTGSGCDLDAVVRAERFRSKASAYIDAGYAGAFAWAWQPGGTGRCEYGNLDQDPDAQDVLRSVGS